MLPEEDNDFVKSGFPSFDEVDIETTKNTKSKNNNPTMNITKLTMDKNTLNELLKSIDPESVKKNMSDDLLKYMEKENIDFNEMLNTFTSELNNMLSGQSGNKISLNLEDLINNMVDSMADKIYGEEEYDDEDSEDTGNIIYELGDITRLKANDFGKNLCKRDSFIHAKVLKLLDGDITYSKLLTVTKDITEGVAATLDKSKLKNLQLVSMTDTYALYYVSPVDPKEYGIFVAVFEATDGTLVSYIPEFRNTFNINNDGVAVLYNEDEYPQFFAEEETGVDRFVPLNVESINFSVKFNLIPEEKVYTTLNDIGEIKGLIPPINKDSNILKVGYIKLNDSEAAKDIKLAADIDDDSAEKYPVYFDFGREIDKGSLVQISSILFNIDFNHNQYIAHKEVKLGNGYLYIDVDLGDF